jgi:molybdopterin-guanine dinucleotide biosynthesis protein A
MTSEPYGTGAPEPYDAVVLAGRGARRLDGADKPGLLVGGRPLVSWVAAAVSDAARLVVVGPPRPELPRAVTVREDPPGAGPIPALRAGLARVRAPWTAVLAADLPFLRSGHVGELRRRARDHGGALFVDPGGRPQWLTGVWRTAALTDALGRYDGASLRGLMEPLGPARVRSPLGDRPWHDCDTPSDVASAARLIGRNVLDDWLQAVCDELELEPGDVHRDLILDVARDVAHGVARPAAPLTAYLIGLAAGRGVPVNDAAARLTEMAEGWSARHPRDEPGASGH